jgi:hypothetical protein
MQSLKASRQAGVALRCYGTAVETTSTRALFQAASDTHQARPPPPFSAKIGQEKLFHVVY